MSKKETLLAVLKKHEDSIAKQLPKVPSEEEMIKAIDMVLIDGLSQMYTIMDENNASEETKIKAFNAIVGAGRYLETRRVNKEEEEQSIIFDVEDAIIESTDEHKEEK